MPNRKAKRRKEERREKDKYLNKYDIELHNSEITQIEENDYV